MVGSRKERLAVALDDIERVESAIRGHLVGGKVDTSKPILVQQSRMGQDVNVEALAFTCDLLEAATVCDVMRSNDRVCGDAPTTVFILKSSTWCKVSGATALTVAVDGDVRLNPAVFPETAAAGPPPPVKAIKLGRSLV